MKDSRIRCPESKRTGPGGSLCRTESTFAKLNTYVGMGIRKRTLRNGIHKWEVGIGIEASPKVEHNDDTSFS